MHFTSIVGKKSLRHGIGIAKTRAPMQKHEALAPLDQTITEFTSTNVHGKI
jgi:hypothetical protein